MKRQLAAVLVFLAAAAALLAGAGMMMATCVAGKRLHVVRFAAEGRALVARLPALPLAQGSKHAVDLWLDYSGAGNLRAELVASSAGGATVHAEDAWRTKSAAVRGSFHRLAVWRPADRGPWTVEVRLQTTGGVEIDDATAGLVERPFQGVLPGALALVLGGILGLAGFAIRG